MEPDIKRDRSYCIDRCLTPHTTPHASVVSHLDVDRLPPARRPHPPRAKNMIARTRLFLPVPVGNLFDLKALLCALVSLFCAMRLVLSVVVV